MSAPERDHDATLISAARHAARRAAIDLALQRGAAPVSRTPYPGARSAARDVEPLAGLQAARELEHGARHTVRQYIQAAREAGHSWHDIGIAINPNPRPSTDLVSQAQAEMAFSYATGQHDPELTRRYAQSFSWTCQTCEGRIIDRGPFDMPADAERGHASGCARLAATLAEWDAQWEAGD